MSLVFPNELTAKWGYRIEDLFKISLNVRVCEMTLAYTSTHTCISHSMLNECIL